jgi:hypothetical protein
MTDWVNQRRINEEKLDAEEMANLLELSKEWGTSLIPGLDIAYKLNKQRNEYRKKRKEIIETQKMMEFHHRLVNNGLTEEEMLKYSPASNVINDYYTILDQVSEDEDNDKIEYYVKLLKRFVASPAIHPDMKKELLKIFRDLTRDNFDTLLTVGGFIEGIKKESTEQYSLRSQTAEFHHYLSKRNQDTLLQTSFNKLITLGLLVQDGSLPPNTTQLSNIVLKIIK